MERIYAPSVSAICDVIGRKRIADVIGVRVTSVSNAVSCGQFPARWFDAIEKLCADAGIACPRHLFSFAGVEMAQEGVGASTIQPAAPAASNQEPNHDTSPDDAA